MDAKLEPGTPRGRPALPLAVLVLLALAVWAVAFWHRGGEPQLPAPGPPRVEAGTATELAPAIRRSPRAVVYVGCRMTSYSVRAREWFLTAAAEIASEAGPGRVRFFVIEEETAEDSRAWAAGFNDERLANLGHLGYGWVLWLEGGSGRPSRAPDILAGRPGTSWSALGWCGPDAEPSAATDPADIRRS